MGHGDHMNGPEGAFKKRPPARSDDLTPSADLSIPEWNGDYEAQ
ncbi:hypothetical protein SJ05684_c26950 [Sinorhizobium sojae CCBAU 05684]|uniref:Uncharacterized protein n=1 Tax=Sinorhizobium sojae CCBAU 05684 TaxID=716928 RepID=A0A249PEK4_9HYPH|nr:hypothetical protein SJ05684_c26950 [Sinorhizobium sojae CCBAU 05684]